MSKFIKRLFKGKTASSKAAEAEAPQAAPLASTKSYTDSVLTAPESFE